MTQVPVWFKDSRDRIGTTRDAALIALQLPSLITAARRVVPPMPAAPARAGVVFFRAATLMSPTAKRAIRV